MARPRLLAGGNPQIPKGEGAAPVRAWLDALPGWKGPLGRRLDALIDQACPGVRRAVKWNSPLYGAPDGEGWFLSVHAYARYLKVAFLTGAELDPPPPVGSKHPRVRYLHVGEDAPLDEARFRDWVRQAAARPGERM